MSKKLIKTRGFSQVHSRTDKYRYISVVSNHEDIFDQLILVARSSYAWYAYIFHEADEEVSKTHIHLICFSENPLLLDSHFARFGDLIPKNLIQGVISPRACVRYLTHKDYPHKAQYKDDDVVSSDLAKYHQLSDDSLSQDSFELWQDYKKLRSGDMTPDDFILKYQYAMSSMPIYQKFSMLHKIYDQCAYQFYSSQSLNYSRSLCPPVGRVKGDRPLTDSLGIENLINNKGENNGKTTTD